MFLGKTLDLTNNDCVLFVVLPNTVWYVYLIGFALNLLKKTTVRLNGKVFIK